MNTTPIITIKNLTKKFPVGQGEFTALEKINLSFGKGEFTGLIGPSGSGKTTLLNIIGSLDVPTEGEAHVMGQYISTLTHKQAAKLRNLHIGFIFQSYNLLPVYTVFENVEFALLLQQKTTEERKKAVWEYPSDQHRIDFLNNLIKPRAALYVSSSYWEEAGTSPSVCATGSWRIRP